MNVVQILVFCIVSSYRNGLVVTVVKHVVKALRYALCHIISVDTSCSIHFKDKRVPCFVRDYVNTTEVNFSELCCFHSLINNRDWPATPFHVTPLRVLREIPRNVRLLIRELLHYESYASLNNEDTKLALLLDVFRDVKTLPTLLDDFLQLMQRVVLQHKSLLALGVVCWTYYD